MQEKYKDFVFRLTMNFKQVSATENFSLLEVKD